MTDPILFLVAVLTLLGTPGPTNTLLATSGASVGIRRSLPLLVAELAGYLIAVLAIRTVLGPVIQGWPLVGIGLKLAVALYLVWMAARMWRHDGALTGNTMAISARSVFLTTLLNPKALIFALSVIPQASPLAYFIAFGVAVPVVGLGWVLIGHMLGLAAGKARAGAIRKIGSLGLLGFAGLIAGSALN